MNIEAFFDPRTSTLTYVVSDPSTRDAVVIDPVLDYDPVGSVVSAESVEHVAEYAAREGLTVRAILETHAHADHLSGSQALRARFPGAVIAIGERICEVQRVFKAIFDLEQFVPDGHQFDRLLADGEVARFGNIAVRVIATPGHTPACVSYLIGDAVFTGDALFMPDYGTGRCDFPRGSAEALYRSVTGRLYMLPDETRVFVGHDYQPNGRPLAYESTIGAEKRNNVQLPAGRSEADFVAFRRGRDATLAAPKLLYPSLQVNIDAGRLPAPARPGGPAHLKIPFRLAGSIPGVGPESGAAT
ncbi:MBL fold metallo-hydrolase [Nannocystis pusilla]|uniref:MBL fold metallo-hydrolase n=1 Tax=Nannocystis pusilla TaxID=889268 RepID=UPI003DA3A178